MIEMEVSSGDTTTITKMKIITGDNRAEVTKMEKVKELPKIIVEGETFVFSIDDIGISMQPVESSTVSHLGWFNEEMFVTFKSKKDGFTMYGYTGVSDTRFVDLVNAKSIGRRFGLMRSESLKDYVRFF